MLLLDQSVSNGTQILRHTNFPPCLTPVYPRILIITLLGKKCDNHPKQVSASNAILKERAKASTPRTGSKAERSRTRKITISITAFIYNHVAKLSPHSSHRLMNKFIDKSRSRSMAGYTQKGQKASQLWSNDFQNPDLTYKLNVAIIGNETRAQIIRPTRRS